MMAFMTMLCLFRKIRKRRGDTLIGEKRESSSHRGIERNDASNLDNYVIGGWAMKAHQNIDKK